MPTDDEIRIILNVLGEEKVDAARKAIEREEEAIRQLSAQLQAGAVSQAQFDAAAGRSAQNIQAAAAQIKAGTKAGFNPQALLEFSRAAEDAQYGVAGVVNNIPGLVAAMGGSAGVAGVASLAAIAFAQLVKHLGDFGALIGENKTLSEAAQMDELTKSTRLAADQADRLARYKAIGAKSEEIRSGKTEAQQATEAAATKAIVEAGAKDVARGLLKADPAAFDAAIPGIADKDGKLLQNFKGENRTALTDARDAGQSLDDYISGKSRAAVRSDRAGGSSVDPIDPGRLQELQAAKAEAEKALAEARTQAAIGEAAKGALPKYFPGGTDQLRERIEANPDAFGPRGAQLAIALKGAADPESAKLEDDDKAARADELNAAEKRRLDVEVKYADDEEKAERKADEDLDARERHYQQQLANWAAQGDQKIADEDMGAQVADAMTAHRKELDRQNQAAQIFNGPAALHDAIQQSVKADKDPTAVEQLAAQREIAASIKQTIELQQTIARRVGGPARAG